MLDHDWRGKEESEMQFFLYYTENLHDVLQLFLMMLKNPDNSVNLINFMTVLVVQISIER